jgi:molybdopterin synthase catalytic subunit
VDAVESAAKGTGPEGPAESLVRLVGISAAPLDVTAVYDAVQVPAAGAVALFVGVVRDHDAGKQVTNLGYTAHPTAEAVLSEVVEGVIEGQPVQAVAAVHRIGGLTVGDVAVIVAVSSSHRSQAFALCQRLIDEIKTRVPIWKHQVFADGSDEWVGTPQ